MVSKVCHSQLSSSTFARAAHIPPWAAPGWERVGYSLVITAVRARRERCTRAPAPGPAVVVEDPPQPVAAVEQGQGEHGEVVDPPERVGPAAGDEGEVDPVQPAVGPGHDPEVAAHGPKQQSPGSG